MENTPQNTQPKRDVSRPSHSRPAKLDAAKAHARRTDWTSTAVQGLCDETSSYLSMMFGARALGEKAQVRGLGARGVGPGVGI